MNVLTWNTACARGTAAAVVLADRVSAEVVLLQEAKPIGAWSGPLIGTVVPHHRWGSWILVRRGTLQEIALTEYTGWVAGAKWRCAEAGGTTYLFSIHGPTSNTHARRGPYVAEAMKIVAAICAHVPATGRLIIGGDFNVKSLGERLPTEEIQHDTAERRAVQEFRTRGFAFAWRDAHSQCALPQTLRWCGAPAVPFHCDGFLVRGFPTAAMACEVLCSDQETRASDHNPVLVRLPVRPAIASRHAGSR
jgi:endonuclease/exonuclease/phosphatase (EEP) superfamily protein YafD